MSALGVRSAAQPSTGNHFAWLRTQMSLQRTLMAAVRTSISLIGFGFTVAQFFERLQSGTGEDVRRLVPRAPRDFGLLLIAAGVVSLAMFTWQYYRGNAYLRRGFFASIAGTGEKPMHNSAYVTSFTVMLIGIAAFVSILVRF